jgi:hypothetical protein
MKNNLNKQFPMLESTNISISNIISRAWRLYRMNVGKVIWYSVLMNLVLASYNLFNMLSATFKQIIPISAYIVDITSYTVYFFILLGALAFCNIAMVEVFYRRLVNESINLEEIITETFSYAGEKFNYVVNLVFQMTVGVIIIGLPSAFIFFIVHSFFIYNISEFTLFFSAWWLYLIAILIINILCLIIFVLLLCIFLFLIFFQFIIYLFERKSVTQTFKTALVFLKTNFYASITFTFLLFFLWVILVCFLNMPLWIAQGYYFELAFSETGLLITGIISALLNALIWPLIIAAFTYFYYEFRLKKQGLDLIKELEKEKDEDAIIEVAL